MTACPWNQFAQSPPGFCEEALCAWVREPANTWSNLAFIAVALVMYVRTRGADRPLRILAHISLATGIGSGLYHASGTAWGQVLDYTGMHLGGAFMLTVCISRWTGWRGFRANVIFWLLFVAAMIPGFFLPSLFRTLFMLDGTVCSLSEGAMFFTKHRAKRYGWLLVTWAFFLPAMFIWYLDDARIWCDPQRHWFSGHAVWHVLNAIGFYAAFLYYRQFAELGDEG